MPIKILHTSDWHLGKRLFKEERIDEHQSFLNWIHDYIINNQIDLLIIAGDIFDVISPPNNIVKMFYEFIYKLGLIPNFKTIIISGNHDSASLLEAPKQFLELHQCYIYTRLDQNFTKMEFIFEKDGISIGLKLLPYFRNYELINLLKNNPDLDSDDAAIESLFKSYFSNWSKPVDKKILVAHHVFGDYNLAGSEQAIYLSGLDHFPLSWIRPYFDYTALGHIHKTQVLSTEPPIIYPGSPIPLRFSESNNKNIIEIEIVNNELTFQKIKIPNTKELIQIETNEEYLDIAIEELLESRQNADSPGFLEVIVKMDKPKSGLADKIHKILSKSNLKMISFIPKFSNSTNKNNQYEFVNKLNLTDLFKIYYKHKFNNDEMPEQIQKSFQDLLAEVRDENSES